MPVIIFVIVNYFEEREGIDFRRVLKLEVIGMVKNLVFNKSVWTGSGIVNRTKDIVLLQEESGVLKNRGIEDVLIDLRRGLIIYILKMDDGYNLISNFYYNVLINVYFCKKISTTGGEF